ncbi:tRNA uridine-5-carboxymethylaminomethyl(34) synthesis GTPase MnmE [Mariprofundus sp. EBB-1]|uniref:tRNA uridine-5-carboxymethylaminomethyl(34) synthesis GTPase MnmE n=1 Tax=Mariprofundus sp. EBB-1 TaxID=2650971 RepID=UPI000EF1EC8A|nr:tRNA uridine-5-carboxymethylaminomethyl(34) synthesis GTPase MnmE [Mariprofundus sp. EBB-1]RLL54703.1 tRNA uridine-5-carboxymethylaminomethyl(34) synthesis GTPase MnmE [Mariprofundus sp. EBB-1]
MSHQAQSRQTTIAAIATPAGRGGVGIVRISGPNALPIIQQISTLKEPLEPRLATFTYWLDQQGDVLDHGLVVYFQHPHSYTGEDVVEIQGHGSPVLLRALLERLYQLGCCPAEPGEFTRRAVENGKINLSQAEAVAACIDAATVRAGKQAQRQLQGAFGQHIEDLMQKLTGEVAHLEASLDFPEEEIPDRFFEQIAKQLQENVLDPIKALLATATLGERLFDGAVVAIIGAPNVGKSSLLNALSGRDRAIVSDIPGTTRDVLEIDFEVHGIPVRLADTAGLRVSDDLVEQEGVRRAKLTAKHADATILVADASRPETWEISDEVDIYLMNKIDLVHDDIPDRFMHVSIKQDGNLESLTDALALQLGDTHLADDGLLVTRERHRLILQQTVAHLQMGLDTLHHEEHMDLTAMEWRRAWSLLGSILGIGDVEYILDRVFSEFCIGK